MTVGAPVSEGDVLAGKYRVERVLGAGGMGVVVAAQHVHLGQRVALKFLLPQACDLPGAVDRFLREARASVQIRSEHVARVSDVGTLEDGVPYMVMEYLEGSDLSALVQARGRLSAAEAIDYLLQACEAVAEAHSLGIVHRDLKPANLFLSRRADGSSLVKVLDFGISKLHPLGGGSAPGGSVTATAAIMGSPAYMSPEQVRSSKSVDPRTDVWSLGVILHELLTGRKVYEADTLAGILAAVVADPPATLRSHWAEAPVELELVILRCLEKDLRRRYQSVAELARGLLPLAPAGARLSVERITRLSMGGAATDAVGAAVHPSRASADPRTISAPSHFAASQPGAQPQTPLPHASRTPPPQTVGGWGTTGQGLRRGAPLVIIAGAVVGLVVVLGGGTWMLMHKPASGAQGTAASPGTSASSIAPEPSPSSSARMPPPATASPVTAVTAEPSATAEPRASAEPRETQAPAMAPVAGTTSSSGARPLVPPRSPGPPRLPPAQSKPAAPPTSARSPSSPSASPPPNGHAFDDRK